MVNSHLSFVIEAPRCGHVPCDSIPITRSRWIVRRAVIALWSLIAASGCGASSGTTLKKQLDLRNVNDVTACPLHNVALQEGVEPIAMAHISWAPQYFQARDERFPLANTGDITHNEAAEALVMFCPECRKARQQWLEEQRPE